MTVALRRRRREHREPDDAFDMPDDHFGRRFRLSKGTARLLCEELAGELEAERPTGLSVERKVLCALQFLATGSFQASVGSEETIRMSQSTVSECVRRVAEAVVNGGARNKWVHFPKTAEEKAAVKEGFLRRGAIPGVIGCVDGSLIAIIAPKGERKAVFMCRNGYYALNCMFICDADMKILALEPLRPGSDNEAFVWWTTWLRRRFQVVRIVNPRECLLGDSGYPLEPWLLTPVPGHPPVHTAEGQYKTAHAAVPSVVESTEKFTKAKMYSARHTFRFMGGAVARAASKSSTILSHNSKVPLK
ncbi:putative nuclease HARBI1 [Dermacentor albipictus]|uniref:putative nuclease HARBI1 n=1 Tax=Dermacentor albipictus TaxID=60249 RepID=UPI0031FC56C9